MTTFLKIYDAIRAVQELSKIGEIMAEGNLMGYYVQEDVHVFHVFRVLTGAYDEDFENDPDVFTVEFQNIEKYEVCSVLGYNAKDRKHRDAFLEMVPLQNLIETVIRADFEEGLSNWDYSIALDLDEVKNLVTQNGFYEEEKMADEFYFSRSPRLRERNRLSLS